MEMKWGQPWHLCVEIRILKGRGKSNQNENGIDLVVSVPWTAPQPIESLPEKPILIRSRLRIATGRADNRCFLQRENTLTEYICTVTLAEGTM